MTDQEFASRLAEILNREGFDAEPLELKPSVVMVETANEAFFIEVTAP